MFDSGIDACTMPGALERGWIQGVFVKPNEPFSEPGVVHGSHPDGSDEEKPTDNREEGEKRSEKETEDQRDALFRRWR